MKLRAVGEYCDDYKWSEKTQYALVGKANKEIMYMTYSFEEAEKLCRLLKEVNRDSGYIIFEVV